MKPPILQRSLEFLSRFSLRNQYRLGTLIAFVLSHTPNQLSRQARQNIDLCCADLNPGERRRLLRATIRQTCYAMTELAAVWCWPVEKILARVSRVEICAEFEQADAGRIILAPHIGSWELLVIWLGHHCNAMILYKRRKNKAVDKFVKQVRGRSGGEPVPTKKHGLRKLLIGLRNGGNLMILPDQKPAANKSHIESSFFGANAPTTSLVQNLCSKVECRVFIASISRSRPAGEFHLRIEPLDHARLATTEIDSAQYMNDQIEILARQNLAQYQWGYRRFANRAYQAATKDSG